MIVFPELLLLPHSRLLHRPPRLHPVVIERRQPELGNDVLGRHIRVERHQRKRVVVQKDQLHFRSVLLLDRARLIRVKVNLEKPLADGQRGSPAAYRARSAECARR